MNKRQQQLYRNQRKHHPLFMSSSIGWLLNRRDSDISHGWLPSWDERHFLLFLPQFENASKVVSKTTLQCRSSWCEIKPGESYYVIFGCDDGSLFETIECESCIDIEYQRNHIEYQRIFKSRVANESKKEIGHV